MSLKTSVVRLLTKLFLIMIKTGLHFLAVHVRFTYDEDKDTWSFSCSDCNHFNSVSVTYDADDDLKLSVFEYER